MSYANENGWIPVAEGLRRRGWDVTTALEEEPPGFTDEEHLQYAVRREETILTFDDDLLSLIETSADESRHPGVVFVAQHGRTVGELVK